jgi:hypothetical protein
VLRYNRDDVLSTAALRDWLERQRADLLAAGAQIERPPERDGAPNEAVEAERTAAAQVVAALREGVPDDRDERTPEEFSRALLADLIDFERREDNVAYWEKFALMELEPEALALASKGVAGLEFVEVVGGTTASPIHRYRYPSQEFDPRPKDDLYGRVGAETLAIGTVTASDPVRRTIDVKKRTKVAEVHPESGFLWGMVRSASLTAARLDFARDVLERGLDAAAPFRAARDLLGRIAGRGLSVPPQARRLQGESTLTAALRMTAGLDGGVLAVQGPPGTGKSFTGAHVIVAALRRGERVGITAVSNRVIANLLAKVTEETAGEVLPLFQHATDAGVVPPGVTHLSDYGRTRALLAKGGPLAVGGTAWLWSRPEFRESLDLLVIDEAGQLSLAAALSVATAARNVLLLGDPRQLEQPIQATHPDGADVAVLRHFIGEHKTVPDGRGLFLDRTFRLAPAIARFTSELAYERRLEAVPGNERIALLGTDGLGGAGLRYLPVSHEGRSLTAPEEVDAVLSLVDRLLRPNARFRDSRGDERPLAPADILVVAPFNRHVDALQQRLPEGVRVGTVDRFQGQEAPVVIYAMGVSSADLAPRGLDFLFSAERFNVATSRAQALVVLVASEALFDTLCRTPEEIRLVNAHVRFLELSSAARPAPHPPRSG